MRIQIEVENMLYDFPYDQTFFSFDLSTRVLTVSCNSNSISIKVAEPYNFNEQMDKLQKYKAARMEHFYIEGVSKN